MSLWPCKCLQLKASIASQCIAATETLLSIFDFLSTSSFTIFTCILSGTQGAQRGAQLSAVSQLWQAVTRVLAPRLHLHNTLLQRQKKCMSHLPDMYIYVHLRNITLLYVTCICDSARKTASFWVIFLWVRICSHRRNRSRENSSDLPGRSFLSLESEMKPEALGEPSVLQVFGVVQLWLD